MSFLPLRRPAPGIRRSLVAVAAIIALGSLAVPSAAAAGATIRIGDGVDPVELRIRPGTTVTFRNVDGERHRLRSRAGAEFDTGNLEPGRSRSITFTVTGHYPYVDERDRDATRYHGTIVVATDGTTGSSGAGGSGGGGSDGSGGSGGSSGGGAASPPASATVHFAGRQFSPASLSVRAGAVVTFRNDDDRAHTATASGAFDTGVLASGSSRKTTLRAPGTYRYLCLIHPDMTGTITVAAAAGPTTPAAPAPNASSPTPQPPAASPAPSASPESPEPSATPGPTIQEAGAVIPPPSDTPASTDPTGPTAATDPTATAAAVDTGVAGRSLLVILVTGIALVAFARLVAGTGRRSGAPSVSRDRG